MFHRKISILFSMCVACLTIGIGNMSYQAFHFLGYGYGKLTLTLTLFQLYHF